MHRRGPSPLRWGDALATAQATGLEAKVALVNAFIRKFRPALTFVLGLPVYACARPDACAFPFQSAATAISGKSAPDRPA